MDSEPLLSFDLRQRDSLSVAAAGISYLTKDAFNPESIREWATSRQTSQAIQRELHKELANPSDSFVKLLMGKVRASTKTKAKVARFREVVKEAAAQLLGPSQDTGGDMSDRKELVPGVKVRVKKGPRLELRGREGTVIKVFRRQVRVQFEDTQHRFFKESLEVL